jgi:Ca-activated chloride channel homolog
MKRLLKPNQSLLCSLLALVAVQAHAEPAPRALMQEGLTALAEERFEDAADAFREAADQASTVENLDEARAHYNQGNALFAQQDFAGAAAAYQRALTSGDLQVQHHAAFNRGNALLQEALTLTQQQALDEAGQRAGEAVESFIDALTLQPDDRDAKVNLEVAQEVQRQIEELAQSMPQQQQGDGEQSEDQQQESGEQEQEQQAGSEDDESTQDQPQDQPQEEQPDETEDESDQSSSPPAPQDDQPPPEGEVASQRPDEPTDQQPTAPSAADQRMEEMTEEEALLVLDALRDEEQKARETTRIPISSGAPVVKDW